MERTNCNLVHSRATKGQGVGFMVELEGTDDMRGCERWLGWIRTHLELGMTTRANHFSSHLTSSNACSHHSYSGHSSRYAYLSSHTCLVSSGQARWLAVSARKEPLGNTTSIGGRLLGYPKGQRIASTHLSFELAAASAGDST